MLKYVLTFRKILSRYKYYYSCTNQHQPSRSRNPIKWILVLINLYFSCISTMTTEHDLLNTWLLYLTTVRATNKEKHSTHVLFIYLKYTYVEFTTEMINRNSDQNWKRAESWCVAFCFSSLRISIGDVSDIIRISFTSMTDDFSCNVQLPPLIFCGIIRHLYLKRKGNERRQKNKQNKRQNNN